MEIQESNSLKHFRKNIEACVDKILSHHSEFDECSELSKSEIDNIINNIMKSKEITSLKQKYVEDYEWSGMGKRNFIVNFDKPDTYDETKFENLCCHLNQNKSADIKSRALKTLLKYSTLDLIDKWPKISKILKDCLMSRNKDIFNCSFKLHIKLSSHPETINDASINLTKTLTTIFQTRKCQSTYADGIDLKNPLQEHILKMTNLLLNNLRNMNKNLNNTREKNIECLINSFLELMNLRMHTEKNSSINFLHYVATLDIKAKWLEQILCNVVHRNIVLYFCTKNPTFVSYILTELISAINSSESESHFKISKLEIKEDMINIAKLSHCSFVLSYLLSYKRGHNLFPIDIKPSDKPISAYALTAIIIKAINNMCNLSKQKRDVIIDAIKILLIKNRHFLNSRDITYALVRPFQIHLFEKQKLIEVARRNVHVLHIVNEILKTKDGFLIIFGFTNDTQSKMYRRIKDSQYIRSVSLSEPVVISNYIEKYTKQHHCSYSASERDYASIGKIIVEYTSNTIRHYINKSKTLSTMEESICELLECCCNIYKCHAHAKILVNSRKLIPATMHLYSRLIEHDLLTNTMNPVLKFLITVGETISGLEYLKEDPELLYILCKNYFCIPNGSLWSGRQFTNFFINLANTVPGSRAVLECNRQLITPYLNRIWKADEDELSFVSGTDRVVEKAIFEFIKIIFTLTFSLNCKYLYNNGQFTVWSFIVNYTHIQNKKS